MDADDLIIENGEVVVYLSTWRDELYFGGPTEIQHYIDKLQELKAQIEAQP